MTGRVGRRLRAAFLALLLAQLTSSAAVQAEPVKESPLADCQAMAEKSPDDYRSYACFWATGRTTRTLDEAARRMHQLLLERPDNPHVAAYLAAIEMDRGQSDRAEELFRRAADGHAQRGWATAEAHVRLTFSYQLAAHQGRLDEAQAQIEQARALMDSVTDPSLPSWLALREAMLANYRLEYGRALYLLRRLEPELFPDAPWPLRQLWFSYMGFTLRALDRLEEAYRAYEQEADLMRSVGAPFDEAIARRNMTLLAMLRGRERAICLDLAEQALAAAERGGNRWMAGQIHRDLSHLTEGAERLRHADEALRIAREMESPAVIQGLRARALALADTDAAAAIASAEAAIALAEQYRDPPQIALSYMVHAEILRFTAPRDEALAKSLSALDMVEATRSLQPDPEIRAEFFGAWVGPYQDLASYLLADSASGSGRGADPDSISQAFAVMERMRARTLLDELEAARASARDPEQAEIVKERQRVLYKIASIQRGLLDWDPRKIDSRETRLRLIELENNEARLRGELARRDPAFAAIGRARPPSLGQVRAALAEDQAMLVFQTPRTNLQTGGRRALLLSVTRSSVRVHEQPEAAWIADAVKLFVGLVASGDEAAREAAVRLYEGLLAAAMTDLDEGIRRLVIVPDGPLHLLPFSALRSDPGAEPLGVSHALTIVPSAAVWYLLKGREAGQRGNGALVFADPAVSIEDPEANRSAEPLPASRRKDFGPLPFARREARLVLRRVGGDSRALVGEAASERAFKRSGRDRYGVIHFATHAVVDMSEHYRSGILLAPGAEEEDGLLQIRELTGLDLDGQLVVLSACRTAGGIVRSGEGVMSLARPFLLAGAPTVVGSLWPLPDRAAAELFDRFYARLTKGESVARAMSEARREIIAAGASPRVWAGVVVLGDGDLVPLPARRPPSGSLLTATLLLVAIVAGGALLIARRRRRLR